MRRSVAALYVAVNVTCALVVLHAVHRITAVMTMEGRTESDSVDGITFFTMAAPAFGVALLVNGAWTVKALADTSRRRGSQALVWLAAVVTIWCVVMVTGRLMAG